MTLDQFLKVTSERIPTVGEMTALCDSLGIEFKMNGVGPVLKYNAGNKSEATILAKLFRREPFRTQVIAVKLEGQTPPEPEKSMEICHVCDREINDTTGADDILWCDKVGVRPHGRSGGQPRCPYKNERT